MQWKPRVTVAAIIEQDGRFLMVEERDGGRRVFNQPAGHLENGETLVAGVIRETLEETGHDFIPQGLCGIYRWRPGPDADTFLRFSFHGRVLAADNGGRQLDADIVAVHWLTRAELAELALRSPMVNRSIEDYLAGTRIPLGMLVEFDSHA